MTREDIAAEVARPFESRRDFQIALARVGTQMRRQARRKPCGCRVCVQALRVVHEIDMHLLIEADCDQQKGAPADAEESTRPN